MGKQHQVVHEIMNVGQWLWLIAMPPTFPIIQSAPLCSPPPLCSPSPYRAQFLTSTKEGTWTTAPVSSVAFLVPAPDAVLPLTPGGHSVI